jgi:hypothetical protein
MIASPYIIGAVSAMTLSAAVGAKYQALFLEIVEEVKRAPGTERERQCVLFFTVCKLHRQYFPASKKRLALWLCGALSSLLTVSAIIIVIMGNH